MIALCKTMEILKAVEATFHRHSLAVVSLTGHICQKLVSSLILTIGRAKVGSFKILLLLTPGTTLIIRTANYKIKSYEIISAQSLSSSQSFLSVLVRKM